MKPNDASFNAFIWEVIRPACSHLLFLQKSVYLSLAASGEAGPRENAALTVGATGVIGATGCCASTAAAWCCETSRGSCWRTVAELRIASVLTDRATVRMWRAASRVPICGSSSKTDTAFKQCVGVLKLKQQLVRWRRLAQLMVARAGDDEVERSEIRHQHRYS